MARSGRTRVAQDVQAIHHPRGAWGEDNTRNELRRAPQKQLIWGWLDSITFQSGDLHAGCASRQSGTSRRVWRTPHRRYNLVDHRATQRLHADQGAVILDAPDGLELYFADLGCQPAATSGRDGSRRNVVAKASRCGRLACDEDHPRHQGEGPRAEHEGSDDAWQSKADDGEQGGDERQHP